MSARSTAYQRYKILIRECASRRRRLFTGNFGMNRLLAKYGKINLLCAAAALFGAASIIVSAAGGTDTQTASADSPASGAGSSAAVSQVEAATDTSVPAGGTDTQAGTTASAEDDAAEASEAEAEAEADSLSAFLHGAGAGYPLALGEDDDSALSDTASADDGAADGSSETAQADGSSENGDAAQEGDDSSEDEDEYADLAIADVRGYVNVRTEPNTDSEIVGKLYDGSVAHILSVAGDENDWFQIVSGNVEGYIKSEYFLYGDAATEVIDQYVTLYAVVAVDRLNVRKEPDIESKRIGYIDRGERAQIVEDCGDWLKVQYAGNGQGYVSAQYVTEEEEFIYAKSIEEEEAERKAQEELLARAEVSEEQAAENTTVETAAPDTSYADTSELRSNIVQYAMQYLGNRYVHGGQTLAGGTDCSGFTCLIYRDFGYSISRTPSGQLSGAGTSIDYSQAQPGDIICYGSGGNCTHVALYIGGGQIIHAANSRKGVIISNATYDTIIGVKNVIG